MSATGAGLYCRLVGEDPEMGCAGSGTITVVGEGFYGNIDWCGRRVIVMGRRNA